MFFVLSFYFSIFFIFKSALRVPRAVTRLTVYRALCIRECADTRITRRADIFCRKVLCATVRGVRFLDPPGGIISLPKKRPRRDRVTEGCWYRKACIFEQAGW